MPTPPDSALDSARERLVRVLTDRFADDTLSVEEFEARLDRMHALADPAALDAMARELETTAPGQVPAPRPAPVPLDGYSRSAATRATADAPTIAAPAGWAPNGAVAPYARAGVPDEGRVLAILSATKRRGAWPVPRQLRVVAFMGEVVVDLREATVPDGCEISVLAIMGNVRVVLPDGADAHVEVDAFVGAADDRTRARYFGVPGAGVRVRVTGLALMAEVRVVGG